MELGKSKKDISGGILDYLQKYPDAGDTLEGICNWWLLIERIEISVHRVAQILEDLSREGIIEKILKKDGVVFYRLTSKGR